MTLNDLGFSSRWAACRSEHKLDLWQVARVTAEHKDRYLIKNEQAEYEAELIGNLRFTARERRDLPVVGDWVAVSPYDTDKALIHAVYPRQSLLERRSSGKAVQEQPIAANIDYALLVQAVDRDFNLNRLERYLALCNTAGIDAVVLLSKSDLVTPQEVEEMVDRVKKRLAGVPVLTVSNQSGGYAMLKGLIKAGKTYCLLGSSGVGKSTLMNALMGEEHMATRDISTAVNKGRHTTSHRELRVLPGGGILIDNPGMREVGMTDTADGVSFTFEALSDLAHGCRFADCTHTHEQGCAVLVALENGVLDEGAYRNYLKLEKERQHYQADSLERRQRDKDFGKMVKQVKRLRKGMK